MNYKKTSLVLALIVALLLSAIAADMLKDQLLRRFLAREIEQRTGLQVSLAGLSYNILAGEFEIEGFSLANPDKFGESYAIVIDRILIKVSMRELLSDTVSIELCEIDIGYLSIIERPGIDSNFQMIANLLKGKISPSATLAVDDDPVVAADKAPEIQRQEEPLARDITEKVRSKDIEISHLRLFLGQIRLEIASGAGRRPVEMTISLYESFEYSDVFDLGEIVDELLVEIMGAAGPQLLIEAIGSP